MSNTMDLTGGSDCCGWDEMRELSSYNGNFDEALHRVKDSLFPDGFYNDSKPCAGAILFTANVRGRKNYATQFAADIRKRKLGRVVSIPRFSNPNTDHRITSFAWVINKQNLLRYMRRNIVMWDPHYDDYVDRKKAPQRPRVTPAIPTAQPYGDIW